MVSIICKFSSCGRAAQEGWMCSWCQVRSVCLTGNHCTPALHDPAATNQALFVQGSQVTLAKIDQRCHLLAKWGGLVFFLSQAEERFDKGLQTHSCKEKADPVTLQEWFCVSCMKNKQLKCVWRESGAVPKNSAATIKLSALPLDEQKRPAAASCCTTDSSGVVGAHLTNNTLPQPMERGAAY